MFWFVLVNSEFFYDAFQRSLFQIYVFEIVEFADSCKTSLCVSTFSCFFSWRIPVNSGGSSDTYDINVLTKTPMMYPCVVFVKTISSDDFESIEFHRLPSEGPSTLMA